MKTIKVTAYSTFHGNSLNQSFLLPAEEGTYYRRVRNPCDYKKNRDGIAIHCGCGYPVYYTNWVAPDGWEVQVEWTDYRMKDCGKNNIAIHLCLSHEIEN